VITGIGHTAYRVSDLEKSLQFYCGVLGFEEAFRLYRDSGETWLVYVRVNDETFIELFPGGVEPVAITPKSIAYTHLSLAVDDIDATLADLRSRGLETPGAPTMGKDNNYQYWIADPDGNRIELMQMMPDSLQLKALAELAAKRGK
jgi:catechol 2,3-dioxygenase-like lactoylglutathione lyase family enzyme